MDNGGGDEVFCALGAASTGDAPVVEGCDEAALVHWVQESEREPDWLEAHRRLQQEGRRSKVNHPSPGHEQYLIPRPSSSTETA